MEINNTSIASSNVQSTSSTATQQKPTLSKDFIDTFKQNAAIALDTSGKYSKMEQLKAYMYVSDNYISTLKSTPESEDEKALLDLSQQVDSNSSIPKEAENLRLKSLNIALSVPGNQRPAEELKFINSLSSDQKEIYFQVTENRYNIYLGGKRYKDFDEFYNNLVTNVAKEAVENAKQAGGSDASKNKDLAEAIKTLKLKDTDLNKFIAEVIEKYVKKLSNDNKEVSVKISLSDEAKSALQTNNDSSAAASTIQKIVSQQYKEGTIVSKTV